ncbi:ADP-ribosyl-(dinitrogen reductase) hydrolase [Thermomonas brevis]|uniref:ADP-ribosyl-(Dinitrogen reductase) hydrolase n=1 Tax=Thermomonas brevis TaxID=215691 RepID=A0A7G9QT20_9GAMM|nr:ADP-ribosyl-(dinitrogen reductase) hydrolase [Thermomonas brevis]QNN46495.1 ADP-ribosyl-(dinitrogen reductase) hydrolase [Thermomonas brevis]
MHIVCSEKTKAKLQAKHNVSMKDVRECFMNRTGEVLEDTSEDHKSDPPTTFFVAPNNHGRLLKVCFILRDGTIYLRTCFEPSAKAIATYRELGKPIDF